MNILLDLHHDELHESLLKLFCDRFGFNVYTPIGEDWYSEGYWGISNIPEVVSQYLNINKDDTDIWKEKQSGIYSRNKYSRYRESYDYITLDAAKEIDINIIIASHPNQFSYYKKFSDDYNKKSKLIMQLGNMTPYIPDECKNILNSTLSDKYLNVNNKHIVNYNQEFDIKNLKDFSIPKNIENINTFLLYNSYHNPLLFNLLIKELSWESFEYGMGNKDGHITDYDEMVTKIKNTGFIWHYKKSGDGYGHTLYKSFFAGKPVILNMRMFQFHRLFHNNFFEDGVTIINCNDGFADADISVNTLKNKVLKYADNYQTNSKIIFERIRNEVDFDKEFIKIKKFIENLK